MKVISDREEMIFRRDFENRVSYSVGLTKKKEDGTFENGYIPVRFRKDTELKNQTKIKIEEAWIDFFKVEKKTIPYIFINKFSLPNDFEAIKQVQDRMLPPKEKTYMEGKDYVVTWGLGHLVTLADPERDMSLLQHCATLWDNLRPFRERRARAMRFVYGDQWGDYVTDPDTLTPITEGELIKKNGKVPYGRIL